ncbi:hypothetical protein RYA05_04045 [Pseudomonas syringae pv. actinidiae]|nr:hypothetical protein [Pseudomonas syringae pv. actinidiae]
MPVTDKENRDLAKAFVQDHLGALASDVIWWRKNSTLKGRQTDHDTSQMDKLAVICATYCTDDGEYQEAERLIINAALAHAAN